MEHVLAAMQMLLGVSLSIITTLWHASQRPASSNLLFKTTSLIFTGKIKAFSKALKPKPKKQKTH